MGQAGADCLGTCGELAGCLAGILGYTLLCMSMSLVVHGLACTNLARAAHSLGVLLPLPPCLSCWQMYCMRFALKGRVQPATQHKIFIGMTLLALGHAGVVMSRDSSM